MVDIYETPLANWDAAATVRRSPRRAVDLEAPVRFFFPEKLEPLSRHPDVLNVGPDAKRDVLIRRLYQYIDFTVELEQLVVNPALLTIAHAQVDLELAGEMRFDAHKIYCDEAYHALFSADLKRQVAGATHVLPPASSKSRFLLEFEHTLREIPPELAGLGRLCFAFVSETLISKMLGQLPGDATVVPAIREVMADHAKDERIHHAYFAKFIVVMWPQLSRRIQVQLGILIPNFIKAFLEPDRNALTRVLPEAIALPRRQDLIADCYPSTMVAQSVRESSKATVGLLARVGALDDGQVRDAFDEAGLLPS